MTTDNVASHPSTTRSFYQNRYIWQLPQLDARLRVEAVATRYDSFKNVTDVHGIAAMNCNAQNYRD